ncbi:MAG: fatty-acyl-CoA synthase [Candidatus Rokubacteria bacterium RIFCSPLOWO2_02_FULL_73_56]|nr:MAG: fatty-acyl-CoA synthase [Candidatus Rokubacteria bacterium RIFCSPLOWO2_02_FULL_73_56]
MGAFNLAAVLAHHADRFPDRACLVWGDATLTYADLAARAGRTATGLARLGLGRGDVVAVLLYNCPEFLEAMFAVARLGAVFMPINWRLAGEEIAYVVGHAGARLVITEPELAARAAPARPLVPAAGWVTVGGAPAGFAPFEALRDAGPAPPLADVAPDDVHRLMYTSGTTGRPKGVMITYANLYWKNLAHVIEFSVTGADRGLACGPLYHVGALDLTTTTVLHAGGTVEVHRTFEAAAVLDAFERHGVTSAWLAPSMVNQLLAHPTLERRDLSRVRLLIDGGEKMPVPLIERLLGAFPNAWFADAYGLTETVSGDTFLDKRATLAKLGSVGKPCLHLDVAIWDDADRPVAPGALGEIVLRGPKVFKGYWRDPEATAAAFRGGWFHTGDIGVLDADGFLYIVDRKKDMIVSGGENIASPEVERVLYEHPAVLEAAVVGCPDARWGEVPVAFVVLREGARAAATELEAHCRARLARFKVPRAVHFVEALPRNPSGKVLKRVLRGRLEA